MIALTLSLLLAQASVEEGLEGARLAPRFRWAVQAIGDFSVGGSSFGGGPGLQLEAGVVLQDTISLNARAFFAFFGNTGDAGGTFGIDFALGRFFTLGTGVSAHGFYFVEAGPAAMLGIPVRLTFNPMQRAPEAVWRKTLIIGIELTPGLVVVSSRPIAGRTAPDFGASGMVTLGYAWW